MCSTFSGHAVSSGYIGPATEKHSRGRRRATVKSISSSAGWRASAYVPR